MSTRFTAAVISVLVICACGGTSGTLSDPNESRGEVVGLAVSGMTGDASGLPISDAYAILIDKNNKRFLTRTGKDGRFSLAGVTSGELTLVINDMAGMGVVRHLTVIGGGANDLGRFDLTPLEKQPEIFNLSNIGFEEKITESSGDHLYPRYTSDGGHAFTFQKLPGFSTYDLVETDLSSGMERVLVQGEENLDGIGDHWFPWIYTGQTNPFLAGVFDDRFLIYYGQRVYEPDPQYQSDHVVSYDLASGLQFTVPLTIGTDFFTPDTTWHQDCQTDAYGRQSCTMYDVYNQIYERGSYYTDNHYYYFQRISYKTVRLDGMSFGFPVGEMLEFCSMDLVDGNRNCVPANPADGYASVDVMRFGAQAAFFKMNTQPCSDPQMDPMCSMSQNRPFPLFMVRYSDMTRKPMADGQYVSDFSLSPDRQRLFYATSDRGAIPAKLVMMSPADENEQNLASATVGSGDYFFDPQASADGNHVGAVVMQSANNDNYFTQTGFIVADVETGESHQYENRITYKGMELTGFGACTADDSSLCFSADGLYYLAWVSYDAESYAEAFGENLPEGQGMAIVFLNMPVHGGEPFVTETADEYSVYPDYTKQAAALSRDGKYRAEISRVKDTGFNQLFVTRVEDDKQIEVTFITAQHGNMVWSSDGTYLNYVTRDPVSGYDQFFRVTPGNFFEPLDTLIE